MSYYQKYRPKKVAELDLKAVRETLLLFLKNGKMSHAYLFVGPRGAGKTSTARIMAQVANCRENAGKSGNLSEPCDKCEACISIQSGSAVDVIEMDAASHRSIDDIRDLREKIRLSPVALSKKIYIIDEVHMLTNEAFNALLKTLEEPPEHAMFFLCTTEAHKVPETIMSRCTVVRFTKARVDEVVRSLEKAVTGESLKAERGALEMVAEATDGSFREGHKLLEQLASMGESITEILAREFLGVAKGQSVEKLVKCALEGRSSEVVKMIDEMEGSGVKAQILVTSLMKDVKSRMEETIDKGGFVKYARLADRLITAAEKVKQSPLPMLPIELALLSVAVDEERLVEKRGEVREMQVKEVRKDEDTAALGIEVEDVVVAGNYEGPLANIDQVRNEWTSFLSSLAPKNQSIAGLLRSAMPLTVQGKDLTLEVFYPFHKDQLEQDAKRKVVEEAVARVWGKMNVKCVLGNRAVKQSTEVKASEENEGGVDKISQGSRAGSVEEIFGV